MPIVVNPGFVWPPETDPVVSPDGRITAIVDPAHAGVLLRADFDDSVPDTPAVPEKVLRRNLVLNPSATESGAKWGYNGGGGESAAMSYKTHAPTGKTVARATCSATDANGSTDSGNWFFLLPHINSSTTNGDLIAVAPGDSLSLSMRVWASKSATMSVNVVWRTATNSFIAWADGATSKTTVTVPAGDAGPGEVVETVGLVAPENAAFAYVITENTSEFKRGLQVGDWIQGTDCVVTKNGPPATPSFGGASSASGAKRYRWTGTANASASEEYTPATPFIPGHDATTARVRFERQDGTLVRSGNPAWAPGGYAHAYDHEATLGGGTLWRAVPIRFDGTEGTPSEYVGAVIPALSDGWAWLKPVADPNKAMLLKVEPPDLSYDGRVDTTSIAGSARPAATWDVLEGFTTQLRSLVREKPVADQLMTLLDEGPVLAQFPACAGLPDFYFIRGKVDLEHVHWDGYPWRRYQWDVISIDRPDTTDSPLRIPDLSYDTVERDWTTYDQIAATVTSYNKLLEP